MHTKPLAVIELLFPLICPHKAKSAIKDCFKFKKSIKQLGGVILKFLIKYQAIKGFLNCDQEIKVNFCRSKILIPVADGSTVNMRVTTP